IAAYYQTSSFTGNFDARGGANYYFPAGAGTTYLKPSSDLPTLIVDNYGPANEGTEFSGTVPFEGNIIVRGGGYLTHDYADSQGLTLDVLGDVTIESNSMIGANGRGYTAGQGPGAGSIGTWAGGGGYGGAGRASGNGAPGGLTYGLASYPDELGSGGGNDTNVSGSTGGAGGGKVKLIVGGTLTVQGTLSADGAPQISHEGGAGSGGSVYVQASRIEGAGQVTARGGNATYGGGGGGGRIALYSCMQLIPAANISAEGGANYFGTAQGGSLELGSSTITIFLQPDSTTYTGGDEVSLVVDAIGDGTLSYQWRREGVPLTDDGRFFGTQSNQLTISPIGCADGGSYDCIVSDDCGSFPTIPAQITVLAPSDYDGSGFVDTDDYTAFVLDFELGLDAADFDGTGFVDTDDFTAFVLAFEAGC
ncbi:MAG TPA: immunoglobulin domain-containing protein, partial [Phycisphaerales bacterium]|nr:immunoglobulin domain-containing protein [Phycisphaerales bacterium]